MKVLKNKTKIRIGAVSVLENKFPVRCKSPIASSST